MARIKFNMKYCLIMFTIISRDSGPNLKKVKVMTLSIDSYLAYLKMPNIFLITAQVPKGSIYNRHKEIHSIAKNVHKKYEIM